MDDGPALAGDAVVIAVEAVDDRYGVVFVGDEVICRADDRGDPVIQQSPWLVSGPEEVETISSTSQQALLEAWQELDR